MRSESSDKVHFIEKSSQDIFTFFDRKREVDICMIEMESFFNFCLRQPYFGPNSNVKDLQARKQLENDIIFLALKFDYT